MLSHKAFKSNTKLRIVIQFTIYTLFNGERDGGEIKLFHKLSWVDKHSKVKILKKYLLNYTIPTNL